MSAGFPFGSEPGSEERSKQRIERGNVEGREAGTVLPMGGGGVSGLASARDRARWRERAAAERARVERALARGPRTVERRRAERPACAVCGGSEILEDEVFEGGILRLGHCRRCDHRWTERLSPRFVPRVRRPDVRAPAGLAAVAARRGAGGASPGG